MRRFFGVSRPEPTTSADLTGHMVTLAQLRLATAIVYHMPGASMTLTGDAKEIFVAPTSESRSDLHPGDLRDLINLCIRTQNMKNLYEGIGFTPNADITINIRSAPPLFESLGAGLYSIIPPTTRSVYCFPTLLLPNDVETIISSISRGTISSTLDYDEALGVTIATFERRQIENDDTERGGIVGEILAECAVAEEFSRGTMNA